jgi:hypothetical protein
LKDKILLGNSVYSFFCGNCLRILLAENAVNQLTMLES